MVLRARLRAGALGDTDETEGLARLTAIMLQRGTAERSFAALNELTDALGASISADAGRLTVDLRVRCLVEDFERLVGLLAEVIRQPAFPTDELELARDLAPFACVIGTGILNGMFKIEEYPDVFTHVSGINQHRSLGEQVPVLF